MEDAGGVGGSAAGDVEADAFEGGELDAELAVAVGEGDGRGGLGHHRLLVVAEVVDGDVEGVEELGGGGFEGGVDGGLWDEHGGGGEGGFVEFLGVVDDGGVAALLDVAEDGADGFEFGGTCRIFVIEAFEEEGFEGEFGAEGSRWRRRLWWRGRWGAWARFPELNRRERRDRGEGRRRGFVFVFGSLWSRCSLWLKRF